MSSLPPPFDASHVETLFEGDVNAIRELIALVLAGLPPDLAALTSSCMDGDLTQAARDAHRLKGTAVTIGAAALAEDCESCEVLARADERQATQAVADRVAREAARLVEALAAWDATLAGRTGQSDS